jgi:hypothetical protein
MSQKSSLLQPARSVSEALTLDTFDINLNFGLGFEGQRFSLHFWRVLSVFSNAFLTNLDSLVPWPGIE